MKKPKRITAALMAEADANSTAMVGKLARSLKPLDGKPINVATVAIGLAGVAAIICANAPEKERLAILGAMAHEFLTVSERGPK